MSNKKTRINVYLNEEMKDKAQAIFDLYGFGLSDAINIFLTQSVLEGGIPFDIRVPNIGETNEEVPLLIK